MSTYEEQKAALSAVYAGYLRFETHEENDEAWCRIVARGRIVAKVDDGTRGSYAVWVHLVEHPDIEKDEVYAIFSNRETSACYRCRPEDARRAILHPSAFNLV